MTVVVRPAAPRWRTAVLVALGAALLTAAATVSRGPVVVLAASLSAAVVTGAVVAAWIAVARSARLVVDGALVEHRHGRSVDRASVGPAWRLIEYRRSVGRQARWLWALFDETDDARIILDGVRWSRDDLVRAFDGTGVSVSSAADEHADLDLEKLAAEQLGAFSEQSDAPLGGRGYDPTVPPMPTRVTR